MFPGGKERVHWERMQWVKTAKYNMIFAPPLPIIMGGLNLKICQSFVGTKIFPTFVGGIDLYGGELKLCGVSNIYYNTFIISFI